MFLEKYDIFLKFLVNTKRNFKKNYKDIRVIAPSIEDIIRRGVLDISVGVAC